MTGKSVCLTSQISAVNGKVPCEIHIIDGEKSTLKFSGLEIKIIPCADSNSAIESTSEFTMLQEIIADYSALSGEMAEHITLKNNPHSVSAEQIGAVPQTRTINAKSLSSDVMLTYADIGAVAQTRR